MNNSQLAEKLIEYSVVGEHFIQIAGRVKRCNFDISSINNYGLLEEFLNKYIILKNLSGKKHKNKKLEVHQVISSLLDGISVDTLLSKRSQSRWGSKRKGKDNQLPEIVESSKGEDTTYERARKLYEDGKIH